MSATDSQRYGVIAAVVFGILLLSTLPLFTLRSREGRPERTLPGSAPAPAPQPPREAGPGSVIFIHPDGAGANAWAAARALHVGPDSDLHWDRLPAVGVYRGHLTDALTATSHGGATVHAYGVRVPTDSFGKSGKEPLKAASGKAESVAREALARGRALALVNSASIVDPGSGAFLASVDSREDRAEIALQMLEAQPHVLLGGGEQWFLPEGTQGRHGPGKRADGRNLIDRARELGYTVVFTREELQNVAAGTARLLGLFAAEHTFNDDTEENLRLRSSGAGKPVPLYAETAPPLAEMLQAALEIVGDRRRHPKGFLVIAEEEGSDNFAGANNAAGTLAALKRADDAIGAALAFLSGRPEVMILTAADSDCGGMQVWGEPPAVINPETPLPARDPLNGAPIDGAEGSASRPFLAAPDRTGRRLPFGVSWASGDDVAGGAVLVRAAGRNADLVRGSVDNTQIYALIRRTLFGE